MQSRRYVLSCLAIMLIVALVAPGHPGAFGAATVTYEESPYADTIYRTAAFSDIQGHWARVPIYRMAAQGVLKGDGQGKFRPEGTLTREEALALVLRIAGLEADAQVAAEVLAQNPRGRRPQTTSNPATAEQFWADGYIQVAANRGIITPAEQADLLNNRNRPAQRQEVAAWLSRALELPAVYGINMQLVYSFSDWRDFNPELLSAIEPVLQRKLMGGDPGGTFRPKGTIKRGEMASVLSRVNEQGLDRLGGSSFQGRIVNRLGRSVAGGDKAGQWVDLDVQLAGYDRAIVSFRSGKGFPVLKNNRLTRAGDLQVGEQVEFILNANNEVVFALVGSGQQLAYDGYFAGLSNNNTVLELQDPYTGQKRVIPLSDQVAVVIDGRPGSLIDLVPGQELRLEVRNNTAVAIHATFGPALIGYETPARPVTKVGRVKQVLGEYLVLADGDQEGTYRITSGTRIIKGGRPVQVADLRIGDRVRVEVVDTLTGQLSRVEVSSYEGLADKVVRGRLNAVYPEGRQVSLLEPQEYFYGSWYPLGTLGSIVLDGGADIYLGNQLVSMEELRNGYLGHEVYIALSSTSGSLLGSKVLVRDGEPRPYNGIIDRVAWALNRFSLVKNSENFLVDAGTIAIRDGKLVDPQDFHEGEHVFLETIYTSSGEYSALMQHFQGVPPRIKVYAGRLSDIDRREVELSRARQLVGNQWETVSSRRMPTLTFDNRTKIWDAYYAGGWITPDQLAESRWSDEYLRMEAFVIADEEDRVLAMTIRYSNPENLKTSVARVAAVNRDSHVLVLDRVQDWSEGYQRWTPNPQVLRLNMEDALVDTGSFYGGLGDLQPGDVVYIVHDLYDGCVLFKQ
ncbi:MAG TPA: S-layer homology domain-containing protein [Clostridia bacterium]|nr:S-layer homology domain-containing protein [Clostridia bacterium]